MINAKYEKLVFSIVMAFMMSGIMSLVITIFNVGLTNDILDRWIKAWSFAFIIAAPTITLVAPVAQKISMQLTKQIEVL